MLSFLSDSNLVLSLFIQILAYVLRFHMDSITRQIGAYQATIDENMTLFLRIDTIEMLEWDSKLSALFAVL